MLSILTKSNEFVVAGEELVKEGGNVTMCAVVEKIKGTGREEGRAEGVAEGRLLQLRELVEKGTLSLEVAAETANMSVEGFTEMVKAGKLCKKTMF